MPIEDIGLSVRARNALLRAGVRTTEQLMSMDAEELLQIRNLGQKTLKEIQKRVRELEQQDRNRRQRAAPRGSYMHGYQEGSEGMRRAVIRELTRMGRRGPRETQEILSNACAMVKMIEVM